MQRVGHKSRACSEGGSVRKEQGLGLHWNLLLLKNHVSPEAGRRSSCIGSSFTLPRTPNITHTPFAGVQGLATSAPEETSHSLGRVSGPQPPACLTAHVPHRPRTRASPPSRPTRTTCAGRASCSSSCRRSPRARPCTEASRPASTGSRSSWRL